MKQCWFRYCIGLETCWFVNWVHFYGVLYLSIKITCLQESVLVSEERIHFRYEKNQEHFVWPEYIDLETFKEKQGPDLLDNVATYYHMASGLLYIELIMINQINQSTYSCYWLLYIALFMNVQSRNQSNVVCLPVCTCLAGWVGECMIDYY